MGRSDFSPPVPGRFGLPSRPGTRRRLLGFAPREGAAGKRSLGPVPLCGGPTRGLSGRRRDLPGFWGALGNVPRSWTPARGRRLGRSVGAPCGLPVCRDRRPSRLVRFRGSITQPVASLSTLRRRGRPSSTQDSLPAGPTRPCRTGLAPAGLQPRVSRGHRFASIPSRQTSPGAPTFPDTSGHFRPSDPVLRPDSSDTCDR